MASTAAAPPSQDSSADSASSSASAVASASLRTATLEALGYVCEEMGKRDDDVLEQDAVNAVLTAVVAGMRREERDAGVRLAATRALCNALEFAAANFESADERAYLMQVMCEGAALAPEARAREASFECLVKVAAQHYDKLEPFMRDLFAVTARAVGGETVGADGTDDRRRSGLGHADLCQLAGAPGRCNSENHSGCGPSHAHRLHDPRPCHPLSVGAARGRSVGKCATSHVGSPQSHRLLRRFRVHRFGC